MNDQQVVRAGSGPDRSRRVLGVILGLAIGPFLGFYVTVAIFVAKARRGEYLFSLDDVSEPRWELLPTVVGLALGAWIGGAGVAVLARTLAWVAAGMAILGLAGWPIGDLMWRDPSGPWAGMVIFSAIGLVLGFAASMIDRSYGQAKSWVREARTRWRDPASAMGASAIVLASLVSACDNATTPELPDTPPIAIPDADDVDAALFILGDGGATSEEGSPILTALSRDVEQWSEALGRDSAVSVLFPGDIVYPVGVREREHPDFATDSVRLWNQIQLLGGEQARQHSSLGLFLAGNHDWGNATGPRGLGRLANLEEQLSQAREGGIPATLEPAAGHPGPAIRDLRDVLRIIMIDVHWFLQARSNGEKDAFFERLREALVTAGDRDIIITAHHPYRSAGPHGTLLPGPRALGFPYLLKKTGTLVQDLDSPIYGEFLRRLRLTFLDTGRPPLAFVGGHDHSLQLLTGRDAFDPQYVLVSGSGSKITPISTTDGLIYGESKPGYMMLLVTKSGDVLLYVIAGNPDRLTCDGLLVGESSVQACVEEEAAGYEVAYSTVLRTGSHDPTRFMTDTIGGWTSSPWYSDYARTVLIDSLSTRADSQAQGTLFPLDRELTDEERTAMETGPPPAVPLRMLTQDSVTASPGATYEAGPIRRFLMGDLHRDLWALPFTVPVLDLDTLDGGAIADELSGGKQTLGLRLTTEGGRTFQFRSIVKDASRTVPSPIEGTPLQGLVRDQFAAQFPLAAMVVADFLEAVGVLVARPTPVVLPDDPKLGPYREAFRGRMGWIEERPNEREGDRPGFAGSSKITGSDELYEELAEDPTSYVDVDQLIRARLVDILVGDWDRHSDQWRWASFDEADGTRWEPIPRDRDWALVRIDGLVPAIAGRIMRRYVGFEHGFPPVARLIKSADHLETRLLGDADLATFLRVGDEVQKALSDEVIEGAIARLPPSYQSAIGTEIELALKERRDHLTEIAEAWYFLRADTRFVYGSEGPDRFVVRPASGRLSVSLTRGDDPDEVRVRDIVPAVTSQVRLVVDSTDVVIVEGSVSGVSVECVRADDPDRSTRCPG